MGQAKQKGTFEQRQQAAYDRIDSSITEIQDMSDALEHKMGAWLESVVEHTFQRWDREGRLYWNVDYTFLTDHMHVWKTVKVENVGN